MGKIVKFCNSCEENFAEKFGFCPICGEALKAFEMSPVSEQIDAIDSSSGSDIVVEDNTPDSRQDIPNTANAFAADTSDGTDIELELADAQEISVEPNDEAAVELPQVEKLGADANAFGFSQESNDGYRPANDRDFYVTVLTEKNVKTRNGLLLGTMVIVLSVVMIGLVASIFNHPLMVGSIGDDDLIAFVPVVEEVPMTVEEQKQQKKDDKDEGGGGGGGRDEQTPTSKGQLATQVQNPLFSPSKTYVKKDFELQYQAATEGNREIAQTDEPYGDPNSKYDALSDGRGTGGGQGSGTGTGQGSGRGTGQGTGIGSGSGSGNGDGNGPGRGSGGGETEPPKVQPTGPTTGLTFISKPTPRYTDAARQNNIQGNVILRITFLSSGQIGSISPVRGLPHGLTEQAIAAARQIRFNPAVKNGQPYSVTKSVQFSFTIY